MEAESGYARKASWFDWLFVIFSGWWIGGVYLDGWAHIHLNSALETFFTPWHAVFYAGVFATALLLALTWAANRAKGYSWNRALPREYMLSLWGVAAMFAGGAGDLAWHRIFGIEAGVDALLSPTHLLLAIGSMMAAGGPLRAIWHRGRKLATVSEVPAVLSFTYLLMTAGFMLEYLSPFKLPWMPQGLAGSNSDYGIALGIASAIIFTGLFMGLALACIRHWKFPAGSFTLILALNAGGIVLMRGNYYWLVMPALAAGLLIDGLYAMTCAVSPSENRIRAFGFCAPAILFAAHAAGTLSAGVMPWSIHAWAGMVLIAGLAGYLMTYLVVPPGGGAPETGRIVAGG